MFQVKVQVFQVKVQVFQVKVQVFQVKVQVFQVNCDMDIIYGYMLEVGRKRVNEKRTYPTNQFLGFSEALKSLICKKCKKKMLFFRIRH